MSGCYTCVGVTQCLQRTAQKTPVKDLFYPICDLNVYNLSAALLELDNEHAYDHLDL